MTRYAVGYMNAFDNDLQIEFVVADSVKAALIQHSAFKDADMAEWAATAPEALEDLKDHFFDGDIFVDVKEAPWPWPI